jgi:hypothetical protein
MNSNQRSQENNQTDNGGNEMSVSSSRGGTVERNNMNRESAESGKHGTLNGGDEQQDLTASGQQGGALPGQQSTSRTGSQTGKVQRAAPQTHESNDAAGGMPRSPGGHHLSADEKMNDDTGLSNTANRPSADTIDEGTRQSAQSNAGRRSDGTPD